MKETAVAEYLKNIQEAAARLETKLQTLQDTVVRMYEHNTKLVVRIRELENGSENG